MVKAKRKPKTIKEIRFVNEYLKTGNATEAAARSYDVSSRNSAKNIGYENLAKLDFPTILDKAGITDDFIAKTMREGMEAKRTAGENNEISIPDWQARLKATELATKAKGHFVEKRENKNSGELTIKWSNGNNNPLQSTESPE